MKKYIEIFVKAFLIMIGIIFAIKIANILFKVVIWIVIIGLAIWLYDGIKNKKFSVNKDKTND